MKNNEDLLVEVSDVEPERKHVWTVVLTVKWIGIAVDGSDDRDWEVELPIQFLSERAAMAELKKWEKMGKRYGRRRRVTAYIRMR